MTTLGALERPPRTTVVVPCYNEARRLDAAGFLGPLDARPWLRLLFVDDGSTDDTGAVLERLRDARPDRIELLRLERNSGKAEAVRRGVLDAAATDAELLGYWDADLATPLPELDAMAARLVRRDAYMVMGARLPLLGSDVSRSPARHLLAQGFVLATRLALGLPVNDTQCGAKLFRNDEVTREVFATRFAARWIFDVEILARLRALDRRDGTSIASRGVLEHPLDCWSEVGGSKLKTRDFLVAARDLLGVARTARARPAR
jgi:glycosyltransferase involved in cell wall biosynthesis